MAVGATSQSSWLNPDRRTTALALLKFFEARDFESARKLLESIPVEEVRDVLGAAVFEAVVFFGGWVESRSFAEHPYYEGLSGPALRAQILQEMLAAAVSGADGIGGRT